MVPFALQVRGVVAAVDGDGRPVDVARAVGREEGDHVAELLGLADPFGRVAGAPLRHARLVVGVVAALDALIDVEVPFADLPGRLPELLAVDAPGVATIVRYA